MKKTVSLIALVALLFGLLSVNSIAASEGSLTIKYLRNDTKTGVPGVELTFFKVADPSVSEYTLTSDFKDSGVDVNDLGDSDKLKAAASSLLFHVQKHGVAGTVYTTDDSGTVRSDRLPLGIYMVAQTKAKEHYETIQPYLIFIPETSAGEAIYNITSIVKTKYKGSSSTGGDKNISISVSKVWDDSNNPDGKRPDSVQVVLQKNGEDFRTVALSKANSWTHTFTELTAEGNVYTVKELDTNGYKVSYSGNITSGFVITNKKVESEPPSPSKPKRDITVSKIWDDNNDSAEKRPDSVTVQLIKGDEVYATAILSDANGWYHKFESLPSGEYTIKEISASGYYCSYTRENARTYIITNRIGDGIPDEPPLEIEDPEIPMGDGPDLPGDTAGTDDQGDSADRQDQQTNIPQTGSLSWPVPVMFFLGIMFLVIGIIDRRRRQVPGD